MSNQTHQTPTESGYSTETPNAAAPVAAQIMPEFVRPKDAVRFFGVGKSTLATWIASGAVKSHLVRRRGNQSGLRLICTNSLRQFIAGHPTK